ncbi:MAG: ATP-binding cassette domain-containing protein [Alphaproteobacteria bacterium]|nr:ATP-binding cassette domain-containing protein [Alphaproteobacteria bacterium]
MSDASIPAIVMEGVIRRFGAFTALDGVDLTVAQGERIVVCGPSGSGKSTLVRCINGLERHDEGTIAVNGVQLDGLPRTMQRIRRDVGMVFQQFNLFPHMTVLENLCLAPVKVAGVPSAEAESRARTLLARVRIPEQADKYPSSLSGGQQQRVAIARALCMEPRIMLFDEPTSALDPEMIGEVLDVIVELAGDGMTMICVTHEMGLARAMADRVVFLDAGRIVEQAPPERFFSAPESERTRQFLARILRH